MPSSYVERLIWDFIKRYILGGFFYFFKKQTAPLTIYLMILGALVYYSIASFIIILILSTIIILLGLTFNQRELKSTHSCLISILLTSVLIGDYFYKFGEHSFLTINAVSQEYITLSLLLFWITFASVYLIIQLAEFFSSTAGLYILLGSDRKWIFLTPLPQLAITASLIISLITYFNSSNILHFSLTVLPPVLLLLLIYGFYRNSGRIVRDSYALYSFLPLYYSIALIYSNSIVQGAIVNGLLTFLGILFMMQGRIRSIAISVEERSEKITYMILPVYGTIMILMSFFVSERQGVVMNTSIWWMINLIGSISAILISAIYIKVSGKIVYYKKRDEMRFKELALELIGVIGKKLFEELAKSYTVSIEKVSKSVKDKTNEPIENLKKTIKGFFDKFFKK